MRYFLSLFTLRPFDEFNTPVTFRRPVLGTARLVVRAAINAVLVAAAVFAVTFAATAGYRLATFAVESAYLEPVCSLFCKCGCC